MTTNNNLEEHIKNVKIARQYISKKTNSGICLSKMFTRISYLLKINKIFSPLSISFIIQFAFSKKDDCELAKELVEFIKLNSN